MAFDPTGYKQTSMANWDVVAPTYHDSWASVQVGPFKSTEELVRLAEISPGDKVLDVACGTGVVSTAARKWLGPSGLLIGIDFSFGALRIARSSGAAELVQMDAENLGLHGKFDRILCQYALMFFPDSQKVLSSLRQLLKPGGSIALGVHGTAKNVPYFSTIMEPVQKAIPDIRPLGAPSPTRFGDPGDLTNELSKAGYTAIRIRKMRFQYTPGTFEQYWSDYLSTTANSIRHRIEASQSAMDSIKAQAEERALDYSVDGIITLPWDVLIATAKP